MSLLNPRIQTIIQQVAEELNIPNFTVHEVARIQFKEGRQATTNHKSLEFSGLFSLTLRPKKIQKLIKNYETLLENYHKQFENATPERRENLLKRMESCKADIEFLKSKL